MKGTALSAISAVKEEFAGASDRAAAIVAAAFLDDILKELLTDFLVPAKNPADNKKLLSAQGPLGSFSARITMAHRLGLISDWERRAIDTIRDVRNDFAHVTEGVSFATQSIRDRVKNIEAPVELVAPLHLPLANTEGEVPPPARIVKANSANTREVFQEAVVVLMSMLGARILNAHVHARRQPADFKHAHEPAQASVDAFESRFKKLQDMAARTKELAAEYEAQIAAATDDRNRSVLEAKLQEVKGTLDEINGMLAADSPERFMWRMAVFAVESIKTAHANRIDNQGVA
ncbi:hypothetical protein [Burkholderia ubonensis]|uniref:hypothetical protein n=1 Tax=Burkholderia ubonensis TaxID=101571 RepID=UPI000A483477|nr:hypothetical protein [Burkholderia ubonensis]